MVVFVLLILVFLVRDSLPLLHTTSVAKLFTHTRWLPTAEPPQFGLLPLILGSLYVTVGAMALAVPLGLAAAVYISEIAPRRVQKCSRGAWSCSPPCRRWCLGLSAC